MITLHFVMMKWVNASSAADVSAEKVTLDF